MTFDQVSWGEGSLLNIFVRCLFAVCWTPCLFGGPEDLETDHRWRISSATPIKEKVLRRRKVILPCEQILNLSQLKQKSLSLHSAIVDIEIKLARTVLTSI